MKTITTLLLSLLVMSCASTTLEDNQNVVRSMYDYFNQHDWEKMASLYAEDAQFLDPSLGADYIIQTRQQTIAKYSEMQQMFPDIHDQIVTICATDDKVVVEFIASGSSGDSIQFKLPIATIFTLKDGMIIKDATYYDYN